MGGNRMRMLPPVVVLLMLSPAGPARGAENNLFFYEALIGSLNDATKDTVREVLVRNVSRDSNLYTDESRLYTETGKEFNTRKTTKHSGKEYARREGDVVIHSNTIEGVFSVFKRGMNSP